MACAILSEKKMRKNNKSYNFGDDNLGGACVEAIDPAGSALSGLCEGTSLLDLNKPLFRDGYVLPAASTITGIPFEGVVDLSGTARRSVMSGGRKSGSKSSSKKIKKTRKTTTSRKGIKKSSKTRKALSKKRMYKAHLKSRRMAKSSRQ